MIQISTPTQAQGSVQEGNPLQGSASLESTSWGHRAQKKKNPGIFAKLLAGLDVHGLDVRKQELRGLDALNVTGKSKKGVSGSDGTGKTEEKLRLERMAKAALNSEANTKKTRNSGDGSIGVSDAAIPSGVGGFSRQNQLQPEQSLKGAVQNGTVNSGQKSAVNALKDDRASSVSKRGVLTPGDTGRDIHSGKGETELQHAERAGGNQVFGASPGRPGGNAAEPAKLSPAGEGSGKSKIAKAGENPVNFRVLETGFSQNQAVFRPFSGAVSPDSGEKENSRVSGDRGKKGRTAVEIRDLRTADARKAENPDTVKGDYPNAPKPLKAEIELPVDLGFSGGRGNEGAAGKADKDAGRGISFEDALARELRGNLSTDIVRDAAVIVRNGGEGTIRLSLRPASLGDVKIRLEMTENKITGHIIVQSSEALRAFERELPVLEKAFRDSGFSETNLDMSLAQDNGSSGAWQQRQDGDFGAFAPVVAAARYDSGSIGSSGTDGSGGIDGIGGIETSPLPGGTFSSASPGRKAVNLFV